MWVGSGIDTYGQWGEKKVHKMFSGRDKGYEIVFRVASQRVVLSELKSRDQEPACTNLGERSSGGGYKCKEYMLLRDSS